MADYVIGDSEDNDEFDFVEMVWISYSYMSTSRFALSVRNGKLGWIDYSQRWQELNPVIQTAYSKWLDKQIYGEAI